MSQIIGRSNQLVLVKDESFAVVFDTSLNLVIETGESEELASSRVWDNSNELLSQGAISLISNALSGMRDGTITAGAKRLYTIPKGVQKEAVKGLEWRKIFKRGGTPVGLNSARTLANGGQIGLEKVRHIAKYFPRHEVDKKGKGYEMGEDGFPSNGRIAWALWGGDAGWRWAAAIVEREDKKALKADAFMGASSADVSAFKQAFEMAEGNAPEFVARVRMDGSGIDRIYKVDFDGRVYFWDDGTWDNLGYIDGDIWTYDKALDQPYDTVEKEHVLIDPDSAVLICARFQAMPFETVSVYDLDAEEAAIAEEAYADNLDEWSFIDSTLTAAGAVDPADGVYSPAERSENAGKQVRDATGKFARQGSRVSVSGGKQGVITSLNPSNGTVNVKFDDGSSTTVQGETTRPVSAQPTATSQALSAPPDIDFSGILGEPRTPIDRPQAQIPGTLPAMTGADLGALLSNWDSWVATQRDSFLPQAGGSAPVAPTSKPSVAADPRTPLDTANPAYKDIGDYGRYLEQQTGVTMYTNAYDHPLLKDWLGQTNSQGQTPNSLYYQPITSAGDDKERPKELTPKTSDVQPIYMAVVAPDDPRAVLALVAIVPESSTSNAPMSYVRKDKKWNRDPKALADLKSATPPPVVPLDTETLDSVLKQVDGIQASAFSPDVVLMALWGPSPEAMAQALIAAGGADRNRGGAEKLRRYWTKGKGAAKIRWGTGGDWKRCVRYLSKYLGPRAKGYCALRHKEATGMWTGDKKHREMYGKFGSRTLFSSDLIRSSEEILNMTGLNARRREAMDKMAALAAGTSLEALAASSGAPTEGKKFRIPLVIPETKESGDGRKFKKGAIDIRELPLPLMWQIKTGSGHDGSVVVGRIDYMERTEDGIGNAYGVFDTGAYGREAERLVKNGFLRGVSADMDRFEATEDETPEEVAAAKKGKEVIGKNKITINKARVMGVTIVAKPAFQECSIVLDEDEDLTKVQEEPVVIPDGIYVEDMDSADAQALVACGMVAGSIPMTPPANWFDDPKLDGPTPLTVTDEGRVYGHIAAWHVNHIGMAGSTKPPRSRTGYSYFHTGVVRTEEGSDVPVGQLTLAGGHAALEASATEAVRHYDDTASSFADVHAGDDRYGIWVSGALRPRTTPEQVRAVRASAPSGDWRPINGYLELVAVCQVNVPGFPIARARVASGSVVALVAAGASVLAKMKSDPMAELADRVERLEGMNNGADHEAQLASIRERFNDVRSEFSGYDDFAFISKQMRDRLASKGLALPDGSYPIRNASDLKNAIQAYGRAPLSKRASVKRHIMSRARTLKKLDLIPEKWTTASSDTLTASIDTMRAKIEALSEGVVDPKKALAPAKEAGAEANLQFAAKDEVEDEASKDVPATETTEEIDDSDVIGLEPKMSEEDAAKFKPGYQPRDERGKFRKVLARLKSDLGTAGLQKVVEEARDVEGLHEIGNYEAAAGAASDLIGTVDRLDSGALNKVSLENVRTSARELGKVIANLPLGFNDQSQKLRYSDLPPALQKLMDDMIERVETKIGQEDADIATQQLKAFKSGSDVYSQGEISAQMSKLLRLLT